MATTAASTIARADADTVLALDRRLPVLSKGLPPPLLSFMPVSERCSDEVVELAPPVDAGDGVLEVSSTRVLDALLDVAAAEVVDGALVEGTVELDKGADVSAGVLVAESSTRGRCNDCSGGSRRRG